MVIANPTRNSKTDTVQEEEINSMLSKLIKVIVYGIRYNLKEILGLSTVLFGVLALISLNYALWYFFDIQWEEIVLESVFLMQSLLLAKIHKELKTLTTKINNAFFYEEINPEPDKL